MRKSWIYGFSHWPHFLCAVTLEERCRIGDKLCGTACEKDSLSKGLEIVKSITDPFQGLDPVVVALADAVGFVIFPGVLYVSTPVADHVCNMAYFRNVRRAVNFEPFGQLCTLESRYGHVVDVMETLECLIGFIEIRICWIMKKTKWLKFFLYPNKYIRKVS